MTGIHDVCGWCRQQIQPEHDYTVKDHQHLHTWGCLNYYTLRMRLILMLCAEPTPAEFEAYRKLIDRLGQVPPLDELRRYRTAMLTTAA